MSVRESPNLRMIRWGIINFMTISSVVVEILQSGPKWWTDWLTELQRPVVWLIKNIYRLSDTIQRLIFKLHLPNFKEWTMDVNRTYDVTAQTGFCHVVFPGFDVWLRHRRDRGVYALNRRFGSQTRLQDEGAFTQRRVSLDPTRLQITSEHLQRGTLMD